MIIIPPEEVDEFLANESGTLFTDEQLTFFRTNSGLIPAFSKAGYSPCLLTNNYIR